MLLAPGERRGESLGCPRLLESRTKAALGRGAEDTRVLRTTVGPDGQTGFVGVGDLGGRNALS